MNTVDNPLVLSDPFQLKLRSGVLDLRARPLVMGVVNVTPDSFSDGGRYFRRADAVEHVREMVAQGADIIDVGGESTRPGSEPVDAGEEMKRVLPVIEAIRKFSKVPVSIDTCKAEVARRALDTGADIINDVSGLRFDPEMAKLAGERGVPVVIMHMKGMPKTMQRNPYYDDVVTEVVEFFKDRIDHARAHGVGSIILDPGIGFGKRLQDNLRLLHSLSVFADLGWPLLIGTSRKSFIGMITGAEAGERLGGTLASSLVAVMNGARIVRVHDVREAVQALRVLDAIHHPEQWEA